MFPRGHVTSQDLMVLVNKMAENAGNNPYIVTALESFQDQNFPNLAAKLQDEGNVVIPNVVTLAFVLETLTSTMKDNWRFLRVCQKIWSEHDSIPKIIRHTIAQNNLFVLVKFPSIEQLTKRFLQA